jgi:hypothetical protein
MHPKIATKNILRCTGHHLEWIAIASEDLRPNEDVIQRAVDYVISVLTNVSDGEIEEGYCPYTHAFRALCLLERTSPHELVANHAKH